MCVRIAIGFLCRRGRGSARNMKESKLAVFENQETWFFLLQHSSVALLKQERETRLRIGELLEHRPCFFSFLPLLIICWEGRGVAVNALGGVVGNFLISFLSPPMACLLLLLVATSFFTRSLSSSTQAKCPFVGTPDLPLMCPVKRYF